MPKKIFKFISLILFKKIFDKVDYTIFNIHTVVYFFITRNEKYHISHTSLQELSDTNNILIFTNLKFTIR